MFGLSYLWKRLSGFGKYDRFTEKPKEIKPKKQKPTDCTTNIHSSVVNKIRLLADEG